MTKFKAGDKVVRTGWFDDALDFMVQGNTYTVEDVDYFGMICVEGDPQIRYFDDEKFKLTKEPQFESMKFRVNSPEQAREIQEALFEMGYQWASGDAEVKYLSSVWNENIVTFLDGTFKSDRAEPRLSEAVQEFIVETVKSYNIVPVEITKETVTIDGKTYDKGAVLKRLAELQEVG